MAPELYKWDVESHGHKHGRASTYESTSDILGYLKLYSSRALYSDDADVKHPDSVLLRTIIREFLPGLRLDDYLRFNGLDNKADDLDMIQLCASLDRIHYSMSYEYALNSGFVPEIPSETRLDLLFLKEYRQPIIHRYGHSLIIANNKAETRPDSSAEQIIFKHLNLDRPRLRDVILHSNLPDALKSHKSLDELTFS